MDTRETLMQDDSDRAKRYHQIAAEYEAMAEAIERRANYFAGQMQTEDLSEAAL